MKRWTIVLFCFFYLFLPYPVIAGIITAVWIIIGGVIDLKQLFRDLKLRKADVLDNGQVKGQVALSDIEIFGEEK